MSTLIGKQGRKLRDLVADRRAVTSDATALATDYMISVTDTSAPREISLLNTALLQTGKVYVIKDESGNAGTNAITINPSGVELIHGALTASINTNWGSMTIVNNGSAWIII